MAKEGKDKIWESFEGRKATIVVGVFCLVYFLTYFIKGADWMVAKILPPLSPLTMSILAALVFIYQIVIWRLLRFFSGPWYRYPFTYFLFLCEFNLMLFVVTFMTWPLYLIYHFLANLPPSAGHL